MVTKSLFVIFEKCQLKITGQEQINADPDFPFFLDFDQLKIELAYYNDHESYVFEVVDINALPGKGRISGLHGTAYEFSNQLLFLNDTSVSAVTVPVQVQSGTLKTNWYDFVVDYTKVGIESLDNGEIEIGLYPNPVRDILFIGGIERIKYFEFFDNAGRKILGGFPASNSVDISGLNDGLYFGRFHLLNGAVLHKKILKSDK